jgi:hypothetical protein
MTRLLTEQDLHGKSQWELDLMLDILPGLKAGDSWGAGILEG